ncbi:MAG: hypothetical protein ACD_58C00131G0011 [uncultured bacterium]|nr:MAG: hypothetical protein ACD_58C00131G0011 [uncultured bacterium]
MKISTAKKLLKMTRELYENEAQAFSDTRKEVWEREILDFVDNIEPGSSVLDLGCGNGRLLDKILKLKTKNLKPQLKNKKLDISYLGIDPSKKLIEMNKTKFSIGSAIVPQISAIFKVGDGLTLKYENKFDHVISIAVLHHIPSEELQLQFLQNIYNSLKHGGEVLISVWNRLQTRYIKLQSQKSPQMTGQAPVKSQNDKIDKLFESKELDQNDQIIPWRQTGQFRYICVFTPTELKNLAKKAGFKNIKVAASKHGEKTSIDKALGIYLIANK